MDMQRRSRVLSRAAGAAMALVVAGCWDEEYGAEPPSPPPTAWVSIDDHAARVAAAGTWLQGDAECPGCFASDWQYGACPQIECPSADGTDVRWSNHTTGDSGTATHGIVPACHCPWPWAYGYCYSACNHVWWTGINLAYGGNDIEVTVDAPGFETGSASTLIQRVPATPAWLAAQPASGQVTLDWTASDGATSYNLYWSTTPWAYAALCTKIENVSPPYTHTGLASGVEHYYFVTALAGDAESFDSPQLAVTPE